MLRYMTQVLIVLLTMGAVIVSSHSSSAGEVSQPDQLKRLMYFASEFGFSGSVLVARNGQIMLDAGYGYGLRETNVVNTATSVFDIGSVTKQFTAAAIAKLEADGKLLSSATLSQFFPNVPKDKAAITVHQLLTHTSGIAVYGPGSDYFVVPEADEIDYLFKLWLSFPPGASSQYSNGDYSLLAYIVERVSGEPFERYLRSVFFDPLQMHVTGYQPSINPAIVSYQYADDVPFTIAPFLPSITWYGNVFGNGSMLSTTGDLYRWISALASGRVVSKQELEKMLTPDPLSGYGYGWEIISRNGQKIVAHGGLSDFGCNTEVQWAPDGSAIVIVLSNSYPMLGGALPRDLVTGNLLDAAMGKLTLSLPDVHFVQADALLHRLAGHYVLSNGGMLTTAVTQGSLVAYPQDQAAIQALGAFDPESAKRLADETTTARSLIRELGNGQCSTAQRVSPSHTLGLCKIFLARFAQLSQQNGGAPRFSVIGSVPSWWEQDGTDATFVRVLGMNPTLFRLHWRAGLFDSAGGHAVENPLETPLRPTSSHAVEGLNVGALNYTRLTIRNNVVDLINARGELFVLSGCGSKGRFRHTSRLPHAQRRPFLNERP